LIDEVAKGELKVLIDRVFPLADAAEAPRWSAPFFGYGSAGLLASSAGRGWSGLAAELRSHSGVIAWRNPRPDTEICVDVHGGASVVTRQRDGITDRTVSERGTIWLSPAGARTV